MKAWWKQHPWLGRALALGGAACLGLGLAYGYLWFTGCLQCGRPTRACPWTSVLPFLSGPVLLGVWIIRFQHKREDIENAQIQNKTEAEKETQRAFEQLQEWAARKENSVLQVSAIYQLHVYLKRRDNTHYITPVLSILRALLDDHYQQKAETGTMQMGAPIPPEEQTEEDAEMEKIRRMPVVGDFSALLQEATKRIAQERVLGVPVLRAIEAVLRDLPEDARRLRGWNLQGLNLQEAELWDADLREVKMQDADLREAYLQKAKMRESELNNADLREANLRGAELQGADLREAKLQGTDLREAYLQEAKLQKADLQKAELQGAELQGANLREAKLQGADLREAKLQGADLREAKLQGADLQKAELEGAALQGADLEGAKLQGAKLWGAKIEKKWKDTIKESGAEGKPSYV